MIILSSRFADFSLYCYFLVFPFLLEFLVVFCSGNVLWIIFDDSYAIFFKYNFDLLLT